MRRDGSNDVFLETDRDTRSTYSPTITSPGALADAYND